MKFLTMIGLLGIISFTSASNLANPASPLPAANILIGASYHLGGYSLTNLEIPSMFNRFHGRIDYAPVDFVSFGVDLGTIQIDVDQYTTGTDTVSLFHGNYGFSGGAHLKLSSPSFLKNMLSVFMVTQGTMFSSKNPDKVSYGGYDGCGVVGLQIRIPKFGFVSIGPMAYVIEGEARGADKTKEFYSNVNNIRGWIAVDYHLKSTPLTKGNAYISLEFSASPAANTSDRIPIQDFSFSISIGFISGKLYGDDKQPR
ncbi:MAG: hypothetical protein GX639_01870 [Fibrobacter sp.]|nr:hypothetical protein [Fibrobacter sp.]